MASCSVLVFGLLFLLFCRSHAAEQWCYRCHSGQSGCGESLDIRLQHWKKCDNSKVAVNYCVKYIESIGGQKYITRGCLDGFLDATRHRTEMPMIRRHGYCIYSKSFQTIMDEKPNKNIDEDVDEYKKYCFCNDWNGCNFADKQVVSSFALVSLCLSALASLYNF